MTFNLVASIFAGPFLALVILNQINTHCYPSEGVDGEMVYTAVFLFVIILVIISVSDTDNKTVPSQGANKFCALWEVFNQLEDRYLNLYLVYNSFVLNFLQFTTCLFSLTRSLVLIKHENVILKVKVLLVQRLSLSIK